MHPSFLCCSHRPWKVGGALRGTDSDIPTRLHNPHQQTEALDSAELYNTAFQTPVDPVHFAVVKKITTTFVNATFLELHNFNITCVGFIVCFIVLKVIWGSKRTQFFQSCPSDFFFTQSELIKQNCCSYLIQNLLEFQYFLSAGY